MENEQEKIREIEQEKLKEKAAFEEKEKEIDVLKEKERVLNEENEEKAKIEALRLAENGILDERSQPLRQYLADCVIPYLTEGLIQIYKGNPENPLDFLVN